MAKFSKQKTFHFIVRGDNWKVIVYSPKTFVKKFDTKTAAWTMEYEKTMVFNAECLSERIVTHEVCHAFISYCNYSDADIKADDLEEIFCQMIEKQGEELISVAKYIYKKIEKYKVDPLPKLILSKSMI